MKLKADYQHLEEQLRKLGAHEAVWDPRWTSTGHTPDWEIKAKLAGPGIEVELKELEYGPEKVFTYKGHSVVIYIREQWKDKATLQANPSEGNKFHFSDCQKIRQMRDDGRFERYVAIRPKTKIFHVISRELDGSRKEFDNELIVCRLCLKEIGWKNFRSLRVAQRKRVAQQFSLEEFFATYDSKFADLPRRSADSPMDDYPDDWSEISERYRESVRWKCEKCRVDLSKARDLLQCHHKNGVRSDNRRVNLRALCLHCHAKAPGHRMNIKADNDRRLRKTKHEQGIFEI